MPDESTFIRVFTRIKPEQLSRSLYERLAEARDMERDDGKHRRENDTGQRERGW
jgi:hypothetical protein